MSSKRDRLLRPTLPVLPVGRIIARPPAATEGMVRGPVADSPARASRSLGWGLVLAAGGVGLLILIVLSLAIALALLYASDRMLPGVNTLGVDLGGKSRAEAVALLQRNWAARTVILDAGHTTVTVNPSMLGVALADEATVQRAYEQGRSLAALRALLEGKGRNRVSPVWRLDPALAETNLRALKPQVDRAPVNAGLRVVDGRVEVTPAVPGRTLDVAATASWLQSNPEPSIAQGRLTLMMASVPPAVTDVSAAVAQANQLLAHPLALNAYDPITDERQRWEVPPQVWGSWLSLSVDPDDAARLVVELNAGQARAFLQGQAAALGPDRYLDMDEAASAVEQALEAQRLEASLRLYHGEQQHTVQPGQTLSSIAYAYGIPYPWIQAANPGIADSLSVGQVLTIPSPDVLLPLPPVENKRIVVSLGQQKMWAYQDGSLKWEWPVSTGIPSSPTAPGVFQIQNHEINAYAANWNLWMPYFMGIYRPVPSSDFMNGFHGFPTRGGSTLLWTGDLGHPVTYGCILISTENAIALYEWAEAGIAVEVRP